MDEGECRQIVGELYHTGSVGSDTLLTTQTPNIIVILLEGCGGQFTELSGRKDITPNLNQPPDSLYLARIRRGSTETQLTFQNIKYLPSAMEGPKSHQTRCPVSGA